MEKRREERKKEIKMKRRYEKQGIAVKRSFKNQMKRKGREKNMGTENVFPLRKDKGIMKNNKKKI